MRLVRCLLVSLVLAALVGCASQSSSPPSPLPPAGGPSGEPRPWGEPPTPPGATGSSGGEIGTGIPRDGPSRGLSSVAAGTAPLGAGLREEISAVVVEIGPQELRLGRNGGSAVVLLSPDGADRARNFGLCQALYRTLDAATAGEAAAGVRIEGSTRALLRPLYWLNVRPGATAGGAEACAQRVASFDYPRGDRLRAKLNLTGRGPYLAVIADDGRRAGVIDLSTADAAETADLVRYFKERFSQDGDVWSPDRNTPDAARAQMMAFFNGRTLATLPRLVIIGAAQAACPLGDLLDLCGQRPRS